MLPGSLWSCASGAVRRCVVGTEDPEDVSVSSAPLSAPADFDGDPGSVRPPATGPDDVPGSKSPSGVLCSSGVVASSRFPGDVFTSPRVSDGAPAPSQASDEERPCSRS